MGRRRRKKTKKEKEKKKKEKKWGGGGGVRGGVVWGKGRSERCWNCDMRWRRFEMGAGGATPAAERLCWALVFAVELHLSVVAADVKG